MELSSPKLKKNSYISGRNLQSLKNKKNKKKQKRKKKSALQKFHMFLHKKFSSHFVMAAD